MSIKTNIYSVVIFSFLCTTASSCGIKKCSVSWKNNDGSLILSENIDSGTKPTYKGDEPQYVGNGDVEDGYHYEFVGWSPEPDIIYEDTEYTAVFEKNINKYLINWKNYDGSIIYSETYDHGVTPVFDSDKYGVPLRKEDESYIYSFAGWDKDITVATKDIDYIAQYSSTAKAFSVNFVGDEHVKIFVFKTQNYSIAPTETNLDYSRNKEGLFDMTGEGQINFKLVFEDNYFLNKINVSGNYKNLKTPSDIGSENIYRVTKISSDLIIDISSDPIEKVNLISDFSSYTDDTGLISFSWGYKTNGINALDLTIKENGNVVENTEFDNKIKAYNYKMDENKHYDFTFVTKKDGQQYGSSYSVSRSFCTAAKEIAFPRVEILTENNVWPGVKYIDRPAGCWGWGSTDKEYVQSIFKMYDADNNLLYDSQEHLKDETNNYTGSKIKVRGNSSSYFEKKPYKLKLNEATDLLSYFVDRDEYPAFASKEWALLRYGYSPNTFLGREISDIITNKYDMQVQYVSLYVNGDYRGVYILGDYICKESCNIGKKGFIVENDALWWNEDLSFETPITSKWSQMAWTFKYPDPDDLTEESNEYKYIQNYITQYENELINNSDNALSYIDINSFVEWMLVHDILGTEDASGSNMYFVKNDSDDSPLKAGPVWDFDSCFGEGYEYSFSKIHTNSPFSSTYYLAKYEAFKSLYVDMFNEYCGASFIQTLNDRFNLIHDEKISELIALENSCFGTSEDDLRSQFEERLSFLANHLNWIGEQIATW